MPFTFLRWTCLAMMIVVGPVAPVGAFVFLCMWAGIGIYQLKNGLL